MIVTVRKPVRAGRYPDIEFLTGFPYCRSPHPGQRVSRNPGGKTNGRFADGRR